LGISGNASLRRLPEFTNLVSPSEIYIEDNPQLEAVTLDSAGLWFPLGPDVRGRSLERSAEMVLIAGNARLERIAFPEAYPVARVLAIQENPGLVRIELVNLERVTDLMLIEANPQLSELSLGELRSVGTLEVRDNPALSTA